MNKRLKILITILGLVLFALVLYFSFLKLNAYFSEQKVKEQMSQELILTQQKALEETQQQIENLRKETEEKIKLETLKNQKAINSSKQDLEEKITNTKEIPQANLTSIIKEWRPKVAYIECVLMNLDRVSGSGIVAIFGENYPQVLTNKHVIRDDQGNYPAGCVVKLPDNNDIFKITNKNDMPASNKVDAGALNIRNPNNQLNNTVYSSVNYCFPVGYVGKAAIGEPIVILGYPYTGAKYDITATEGIISGYDGDYYITSAKVEHGNSGGIAILVKDNCYLGIPTYVKVGTSETLARILDINSRDIFSQ